MIIWGIFKKSGVSNEIWKSPVLIKNLGFPKKNCVSQRKSVVSNKFIWVSNDNLGVSNEKFALSIEMVVMVCFYTWQKPSITP